MPEINVAEVPERQGTGYPPPFDARKALGQSLPKAQLTPQEVKKAMLVMGAELEREYPIGTSPRTRYCNAALRPDQASAAD